MAKVYLICGKICSGKSTYAKQLQTDCKGIILSVDEIMLAVFGLYAGEKHDEYAARIRNYLFEKSLEIVKADVNVILDWGFWTRAGRTEAKSFYKNRNIECELHYINVPDNVWNARINQRNQSVIDGKTTAYIVDSNLAAKFESKFEQPDVDEIDLWINE